MSRIGKAISSIAIMFAACSACTSSSPTEDDGKALLLQKLDRIFVPPFSIESFTKTNGQDKKELGVEVYEIAFTALAKYPGNDILWVYPFCPRFSDPNLHALFDKANKSIVITGSSTFEKTQSGWVGQL